MIFNVLTFDNLFHKGIFITAKNKDIVIQNDPYEPSFIARLLFHNGANSKRSSLLTNILTTFIFAKKAKGLLMMSVDTFSNSTKRPIHIFTAIKAFYIRSF